jgi:DNA-binding transcriptional LysR family regulator
MQLIWAEALRETARHGTVSGAAQSLGYSQSAVSRHLAALEAEFGAQLLQRLPRGVALTDAGVVVLEHLSAALLRVGDARADVQQLLAERAGRLRVGAFPTALTSLVPRALSDLRRRHPGLSLALVEGRTPLLLDQVIRGDADVAIVSCDPSSGLGDIPLAIEPVLDEKLFVAVASTHRLAQRRVVRLAELRDDAFIVGSALNEHELLRARLPAGFAPKVDLVVADWNSKMGCVAAGLGVALLPALAAESAPRAVRLIRLHDEEQVVRRVLVATVSALGTRADVRMLIDRLRANAKALPGTRVCPQIRHRSLREPDSPRPVAADVVAETFGQGI